MVLLLQPALQGPQLPCVGRQSARGVVFRSYPGILAPHHSGFNSPGYLLVDYSKLEGCSAASPGNIW